MRPKGYLWEAGQIQESVEPLQRALEQWPTWSQASLWLFHALRDLGQINGARAELNRFLALRSSNEHSELLAALERT